METQEERYKRLTEGEPTEAILTLINSQGNYFIDAELKPAVEQNSWHLLTLGIHVVVETWAAILFPNCRTTEGFKRYLERFVDGDEENNKFSLIAKEINDWRNVIAHQWLSSIGHRIGFDTNMQEGWKRENGVLHINPRVYFECFISKFNVMWSIIKQTSTIQEREEMKRCIINKYLKY